MLGDTETSRNISVDESLDTKADPQHQKIVKVIEPEEFIKKTGYTSPAIRMC
jgi:hypothetical protein